MPAASARLAIAAASAALLGLSACSSGPDPSTLGKFGWMVGCWRSADGSNTEVWSAPQGGVMFGYATTMQGGQLAFFEQSRIDLRQANAVYTASPAGQRPTEFVEPTVREAGIPGAVFLNEAHDYPQRIAYRPDGRDGLAATISLKDGGRATEYSWKRCD